MFVHECQEQPPGQGNTTEASATLITMPAAAARSGTVAPVATEDAVDCTYLCWRAVYWALIGMCSVVRLFATPRGGHCTAAGNEERPNHAVVESNNLK